MLRLVTPKKPSERLHEAIAAIAAGEVSEKTRACGQRRGLTVAGTRAASPCKLPNNPLVVAGWVGSGALRADGRVIARPFVFSGRVEAPRLMLPLRKPRLLGSEGSGHVLIEGGREIEPRSPSADFLDADDPNCPALHPFPPVRDCRRVVIHAASSPKSESGLMQCGENQMRSRFALSRPRPSPCEPYPPFAFHAKADHPGISCSPS